MKTKIYTTFILVQCTLALSYVSQAQFPEFTMIDTGAIYTSTGHHISSGWFDMDNDNDMDVIITNTSGYNYTNHPNLLYKNELNGYFIQVANTEYTLQSLTVGLPGPFGDIDNDGDQDLINADWLGTDHFIYQNDGYGNFVSLQNLMQLVGSTSVLFDLDNDSFLDIIQFHKDGSRVYANNGTGNFVDYIDLNIPCLDPNTVLHNIALGDADNDGDFDLYIGYTKTFSSPSYKAKNEFFLNNGSGGFIRQSDQAIIVQDLAMTPSINWVDYDNDGDMDLYVLNSFDKSPANSISGALFENKGELVFEKHIIEPAVYRDANRISSVWGDLDNDADLDLYITIEKNPFFSHVSSVMHNLLLQNNGDGTFSEITVGTLATESSHTATFEDIDNDGDLDVLMVRYSWANNGNNTLCMNEGNDNSWLILNLKGTLSNKTAFGARIIAKATINGQLIIQTREITPMSGHATYNSTRVHFGMGDAAQVDTLIIQWPSGHVDEYFNLETDRFYHAIENAGIGLECMTEGIVFTSQEQIDDFQTNYPNCIEISGDVEISGSNITNLNGLSNIHLIAGKLVIHSNEALENLSGLENLESVGGNCEIYNNGMLESFEELVNLNYIGKDLKIQTNNALANISGLDSLHFIGEDLIVSDNNVLTSLSGLDNIEPGSIGDLYITNNDNLSYCAILSICEYLINPGGNVNIQNNAPGCDSPEEVEEACDPVGVEKPLAGSSCLIFPNPVSEKLTHDCSGMKEKIERIEIYNTFGVKVAAYRVNQTDSEITLDVKALPPGLYFIRLQAGNEVSTGKIIKQ